MWDKPLACLLHRRKPEARATLPRRKFPPVLAAIRRRSIRRTENTSLGARKRAPASRPINGGLSVAAPSEIMVAADLFGDDVAKPWWPRSKPVTHMNDALLSKIDMRPLESFTFKAANSEEVQGFIIKPPGFDPAKKYPLKFLIHGGPQGAWGNSWTYRWNAELFAADGYVVVMINFHGSTGYGQKFTDSISGDWGGKPYIDLMKGLDYVEKTYPFIDKNREAALGASYGGFKGEWLFWPTNPF